MAEDTIEDVMSRATEAAMDVLRRDMPELYGVPVSAILHADIDGTLTTRQQYIASHFAFVDSDSGRDSIRYSVALRNTANRIDKLLQQRGEKRDK